MVTRTERLQERLDDISDFGEEIDWKTLRSPQSYYPSRLEYLAGKILSGLLTGASLKDHEKFVLRSVRLAQELEKELDSAQER